MGISNLGIAPISWVYCLAYVAIVLIVSTMTYNFIEVLARQRINGFFKSTK